jgi:hypothetical protein
MMTRPSRSPAILLPLLFAGLANGQNDRQIFTVVEATMPEMRTALESKRTTSRELVMQYLTRIATYDRMLHSLVTVNPKTLAEAEERDRERASGKVRGLRVHGIPIALTDTVLIAVKVTTRRTSQPDCQTPLAAIR